MGAYYSTLGQIPPSDTSSSGVADGALRAEAGLGTEGFVGPTSTIYHIHPPTQVAALLMDDDATKVEAATTTTMRRTSRVAPAPQKGDPVTGRVVRFGNADCEMSVASAAEPMDYHYKNGQPAPSCLFIHGGIRHPAHPVRHPEVPSTEGLHHPPKGVIYRMEFDEQPADEPSPAARFG